MRDNLVHPARNSFLILDWLKIRSKPSSREFNPSKGKKKSWAVSVQYESFSGSIASNPKIVSRIKRETNRRIVKSITSICRSSVTINLFPLPTHSPSRASAGARAMKILGIRAGLARVTPHKLRHGFAIRRLGRGAEIHILQEWLGRVSIQHGGGLRRRKQKDFDAKSRSATLSMVLIRVLIRIN